MDQRRVSLRIKGRVQGVFFRESARSRAAELGVRGWVRNRPDGDVEALMEGPRAAVDALVAWCHKGPPAAHVDQVLVQDEDPRGDLSPFAVVR
ncbi:MAG TPA: acylphosphatase [Myxococcales bacterium]|jgi:acylphosphatase|nr:acylphosphatase [Myxococcales bacterium]